MPSDSTEIVRTLWGMLDRDEGDDVWEVFSEVRHDLEEIIEADDGETVVTVQKTVARMRHTGLDTGFRWAVVWRLKGGKVVQTQGYHNKAEALAAVGIA